ncbi:Motility protein B [wastewater metagenome]|uniref:Motility protein B n=2 Tax=unclassified sequences TaxID=12908 RepID=A0A5B8RJU0_9ZZZZ|nr:type VI secretion system protein TssL, long form [Arhodomonas aquaeolei]MCS4502824.1 type VI secretion system protein TssL, long form [Arhodomonas aquaeolei]QEA07157.1 motility protein B [uncultured organism]
MIGDAPTRRQKRQAMPPGAPQWMATFADLATILLSFFVLLLSFSEMDVEKYKQVAGSMRNAFGVQRIEFASDVPKGTSFVQQEFETGQPQKTSIDRLRQITSSAQRRNLTRLDEQLPIPVEERQRGLKEQAQAKQNAKVEENLKRLRALLAEEIKQGLVEVKRAGTRIIIRIRERGSFPTGSDRLIKPFKPVVEKIATALGETAGGVTVAGHTDNVPIDNDRFRSNWALSAARAVTMYHRLVTAADLDPKRFTVEGHADTRPVASNDTPEGRAQNRRVEVILEHGGSGEIERSIDALLGLKGGGKPDEPSSTTGQ